MSNLSEPLYTKQGIWASAPRLMQWWVTYRYGGKKSPWPHLVGAGLLGFLAWPLGSAAMLALAAGWVALALLRSVLGPRRWRRKNPQYQWLDRQRWQSILSDKRVTQLVPVIRRLDAAADYFHELVTLSRVGPWADDGSANEEFIRSIFQPSCEIMNHLAGLAAVASHADDSPVQLRQILDGMDRSVEAMRNAVEPLRNIMTQTDGASSIMPDLTALKNRMSDLAARAEAEAEVLQVGRIELP